MSLSYLIRCDTPVATIGDYLDGLGHDHRLHEVRSLAMKDQERLWRLAAASPPLTLDHFVPPRVPDLREVIHHGKNSLPVFTTFQKRFCRPPGDAERLFGYNEGITRPVVGPGFFVVHPTAGNPAWEERGAVVVDYWLTPEGSVDPRWPRIVGNAQGLQRFVYYHTRDFMRGVSAHVSIGKAWKVEKPLPAFFLLCRED
ncbi:MAG: hypothetical protein FJ098_09385 [Deltaproteobacteria bacterium]|nr:hypothetical protein [Deltaproteobacteria bacterium]